MTEQPANLVLEMLREIRDGQTNLKQDVRAMRETQAMHGMMLGELVKAAARYEGDHIGLTQRVERIERRLGIIEAPTEN